MALSLGGAQLHAFGRRQGHASPLRDLAETLPACLGMYAAHPSTQVGLTWGDMSPGEQHDWAQLRCDDHRRALVRARRKRQEADHVVAAAVAMHEPGSVPFEQRDVAQQASARRKYFVQDGVQGTARVVWNQGGQRAIRKVLHSAAAFATEAMITRRMSGRPHFPVLLRADAAARAITTLGCGYQIDERSVPGDWRAQMRRVHAALRQANVWHNDIWARNILVDDKGHYV